MSDDLLRCAMGIVRFFLSLCVVVYHLTAKVPDIGILAVCGFYVISGFLMTLVLNETYKFDLRSFALNRFLRLYPGYFVAAVAGLMIIGSFSNSAAFHGSWGGTAKVGAWLGNALIFPWAFLSDSVVPALPPALTRDGFYFRIIPSTWSVGIELCCYFLMWLIGARGLRGALLLFVVGAAWHVYFYDNGGMRYVPVPAAAVPFSLGALAYFGARSQILRNINLPSAIVGLIAMFLINWMWLVISARPVFASIQYYSNMAVMFLGVLAINRGRLQGWAADIDETLGAMAYPMFLIHYLCGIIAWNVLGGTPELYRSWQVFWLALPLVLAASYAIVKIIDEPIGNLRHAVRLRPQAAPLRS